MNVFLTFVFLAVCCSADNHGRSLKCAKCGYVDVKTGHDSTNPAVMQFLGIIRAYYKDNHRECVKSGHKDLHPSIECDTYCYHNKGTLEFRFGSEYVTYDFQSRGCARKNNTQIQPGCVTNSKWYKEFNAGVIQKLPPEGQVNTLIHDDIRLCYCDKDFCNVVDDITPGGSSRLAAYSTLVMGLVIVAYKMI